MPSHWGKHSGRVRTADQQRRVRTADQKGEGLMATQAQLEANRQNAQKSTGPKTAEGKVKASQNALTHGLTASFRSLLPNECPVAYDTFLDEMNQSLHPGSPLENVLVRRITDTLWRLQRVPDAEAQLFAALADKARSKVQKENDEEQEAYEKELRWKDPKLVAPLDIQPLPDDPSAAQALAQAFLKKDTQNPFMRLQRYEQSLNRTLNRSLYELHQLQRERAKDPRDDNGLPLQIKVNDLQNRLGAQIDQNISLQAQLRNLQRDQQAQRQNEPNSAPTPEKTSSSNTAPAQKPAPTPHVPTPHTPRPSTDPRTTDPTTDHEPLTTDNQPHPLASPPQSRDILPQL